MGASRAIRDALIDVITPLQLDGETAFVQVQGHASGEFDGYPSVRVLPGDQTSEKAAYGQNDRTPAFIVRTHVPETADGSDIDRLLDLTDLLMDALDEADFTNTLPGAGLDTYVLTSDRGDWNEMESAGGVILTCDINVQVTYSKNL